MEAIELLNYILDLFKNSRNNDEILKLLKKRDLIYSGFEERYLKNNDEFDFEFVKSISHKNNLITFYLDSSDGSPYKMELFFDKKWYLKSLLFQCQGCFGDDDECNVCGGSGWGVL